MKDYKLDNLENQHGQNKKREVKPKTRGFGYQVLGFGSGGAGQGPYAIDYLVVAGGGGGGGPASFAFADGGGGGGAGGYRTSFNTGSYDEPSVSEILVDPGEDYSITVGGAGRTSTINGSPVARAGGGGKGSGGASGAGSGGSGGGASGNSAASANTGGGGGGGQGNGQAGNSGGSGIVILRPADSSGGTKTTSGTDTIHTFTGDGTYTA